MASEENASPLKGVILCGTSLDQDARQHLTRLVEEQLGAVHKLDLTSDVTHLIVGSTDSEKYRHVARHRPDIAVLKPEWLAAVRDAWTAGDAVDLEKLDKAFALPAFYGLNICLTGFTDPRQRQSLQLSVEENGATYHGDLTKTVTHLIVAKAEGAKYDRARVWNIKSVSTRWFNESLRRGMILDEAAFDPLLPLEQQGQGAYQPRARKGRPAKRGAPGDAGTGESQQKRKIRRTASTRLNSQSQDLWGEIHPVSDAETPLVDDSWSQSVGGETTGPRPTVETQPVAATKAASRNHEDSQVQGIFSGWRCFIFGHDGERQSKLRMYLSENAAEVVDSADVMSEGDHPWTALILPTDWIAKENPPQHLPKHLSTTKLVTEWWVERCIIHKRLLDPDKDIFSQALLDVPADLFAGHIVSSSGLGQDVRYVAKLITAAGGEYEENLTRKTTILVHNPNKTELEKPVYCVERGIDVVTPEWIYASIRDRQLHSPPRHYLPNDKCTAIQQVIQMNRRKAEGDTKTRESQGRSAAGPTEADARATKKSSGQRLTGVRRGMPPSLSLARSLPAPAKVRTQPAVRPPPLEEVHPNSQERSKSQPSTSAGGHSDHNASQKDSYDRLEKENDEPAIVEDESMTMEAAIPTKLESRPTSEHTTILSDLLAKSRKDSSSVQSLDRPNTSKRKRTLGRAASGNTAASFRSVDNPFLEAEESASNPFEAPLPSQQLTYDAPGAQEYKKLMAKKMGTRFDDESGKRVVRKGTVRDADSGGRQNVAGRLRGRHRDQGTPEPW